MKKIKIYAIAAMIFAVASAFRTKESVNGEFTGLFMYDNNLPQQCVTDHVCLTVGHTACDWQSYAVKMSQFNCETPVNSFKN